MSSGFGSYLPGSYEDLVGQASAALGSGDVEASIAIQYRLLDRLSRLSDRVLARRPDLRDLHRQVRLDLKGILVWKRRLPEAIEVMEVLLRTHPEQSAVWRAEIALLHLLDGDVETGLDGLESLTRDYPDEIPLWLLLADEARVAGYLDRSRAALDRALQLDVHGDEELLGSIHYIRFLVCRDLGQVDDALAAWEEALAHDPRRIETIRAVYSMLTKAGRYDEALSYVARDENQMQAAYQRALIASRLGRIEEARQGWQEVAEMDPDEYEYGHDAWVEAVLRLGDPDPALEWLQEALAEVGTARLFALTGMGWAMKGDVELPEIFFQRAAIDLGRSQRPQQQKLDSAEWRLFDSLVAEDEIKAPLKSYFAVVETL